MGSRGASAGIKNNSGGQKKTTYDYWKDRQEERSSFLNIYRINGHVILSQDQNINNHYGDPYAVRKGEWYVYDTGGTYEYVPVGDPGLSSDGTFQAGKDWIKQKPIGKLTWGRYESIKQTHYYE